MIMPAIASRLALATAVLLLSTAHAQHQGHERPASAREELGSSQGAHQHGHGAAPGEEEPPRGNHHAMPNMAGMDHRAMDHSPLNAAGMFLMGQSSGTSYQPSAWPMPMAMNRLGRWSFMWMGQAYLVGTVQSGPRGGDKLYSSNWGMLGAVRSLGRGSVMLRSMVSLDPATITHRYYPLLFQTGEAAFGQPIVDGQHPHDLFMELAAQYARPVGEKGMWNAYYAPVGDVALGPTAFPHRASAMELPQATLAHHWQDATHIANNVVTTGLSWGNVRLEASGFHGREPNENRWNIDLGKIDSWSSRFSVFPSRKWMAQASIGRLENPEQFHPDDVVRATASIHHVSPRPAGNYWATSFIWARNYKTLERLATQAVVAETVVPFRRKNFVTARFEWSQRDELFERDHDLAHEIEERTGERAFPVTAYIIGYTRDVEIFRDVQTGVGINLTAYAIDDVLKPYYGSRPWGLNVFVRVRLKPTR